MKIKFGKLIIVGACVGLVLVGLNVIKNQSNTEVSAEFVERRSIENTVEIKGTIKGRDSEEIYSVYGKKVKSVYVAEGDKVNKGDTLCELVSINDEIGIEQAELLVEDAKRELENVQELYTLGTVTEYDLKAVESSLKQAELNLKSIKDGSSFLKSSISGTVTRVNTKEGKTPLNTDILFVIEDIDELQMELKVSDDDICLVKPGQTVRIDTPVEEGYVYGKVEKIALTGEEKNVTSSDMVIPVTVILESEGTNVIAGITGKAEIIVESLDDVLSVPVTALSKETDGTYIYLVKNDILEKKGVMVLIEGEEYAAVSEDCGVAEGDQVVISPGSDLSEGLKVKVNQ